ncbi:hypothetical protein J7I94_19085 [Streptomyces sp. ISL-12]|uniref:hypothetical protein n=1 Tax=Streptomyces sp. ISL-12 TaxID=2819177 RepID=UPI001BE9AE3B|nr:hypothetical protein [Streptomyces sp. ISL-12]MBT2412639.1 hypothetical protein [Streptomyces sp. ISL-12]
MSLRRLRVLIEHLPPESATKTAIRNAIPAEEMEKSTVESRPDLAPWSGTETLLARVMDEIRLLRHTLIAVNGNKPPAFEPTPRPGIPPKRKQTYRRLDESQRRALDPRLRNQPPKEA